MYFVDTAKMLFDLLLEIEKKVWITIDFINLWWWIWIPYKPEDTAVDYDIVSQGIKKLYDERFKDRETPIKIVTEMWRMITWPYWYLVSKVIHLKDTYKKYVWLDASMSNLMRPWMYWAYHHITVLWKEDETELDTFDVTWSLCENNDKFAIDRLLPADIKPWDIIAIHDAWAHGYAMWFNYNAKLKSKELLMKPDWTLQLIRRAETLDDYFATLDFEGSEYRNFCKIHI
jgi:diaminopimelate decarboxylase